MTASDEVAFGSDASDAPEVAPEIGSGPAAVASHVEGAVPRRPFEQLEDLLGYRFNDKLYLSNALVHKSYLHAVPDLPSGSNERLEFDHIIPVSKGGSNTARNIELRCEACNRRKGAAI